MLRINKVRIVILSFSILILSGCLPVQSIKADNNSLNPNNSVIFGSIHIENSPSCTILVISEGQSSISIVDTITAQSIKERIDKDEKLYWDMPPGDYTIISYNISQQNLLNRKCWGTIRVNANFKVPRSNSAVYIGKLMMNFDAKEVFTVVDDYDQAIEKFKSKFSNFKGDIIKSLMTVEKEP